MDTATESICPKGWSLPTTKQIDANRDTTGFSPVFSGNYVNGDLHLKDKYGLWWGSMAVSGYGRRYYLSYDGSNLSTTASGIRRTGIYIRCVSEEKTATDLTYMQDVTPGVVEAT